jgi:hypothetical protein
LFAFILAESLGLSLAGFVAGAGGAWLLFTHGIIAALVFFALAALTLAVAVREAVQMRIGACIGNLFVAAFVGWIGGLVFGHPDISQMTNGIFVSFEVTPKILGITALVASALGIVASIAPSVAVAKMSVVNGLKTLD